PSSGTDGYASATSSGSIRATSQITRSGGSTPSALTTWWSGSSASSFPRRYRSTPTSRIVAMPATITPPAANTNGSVGPEPDLREQLVERDAEPPIAVEEEQQPEEDQRRPGRDLDHLVVGSHPAERAHRMGESDPREDEGGAEAERVREQEHDAPRD